MEVDVVAVEFHQFAHADACRCQHIDDGEVALVGAVVAQLLQLLVAQHFFYKRICLYFVNSTDWALCNIVFVFEPRKEAGKNATHVVDGHFARMVLLLIMG